MIMKAPEFTEFIDDDHEERYQKLCEKADYLCSYREAAFYTAAIYNNSYNLFLDYYDFDEDQVCSVDVEEKIKKSTADSAGKKIARFAIHLYNHELSDIHLREVFGGLDERNTAGVKLAIRQIF